MSKRLEETKKEKEQKIEKYNTLEQQKQEIIRQQNEVGKEVIRLDGKIEAFEETKK